MNTLRRILFALLFLIGLAAAGCAGVGYEGPGVGVYYGPEPGPWFNGPWIYGHRWHYHHGWAHVHPWGP
ncbi:MAG: hypothetical protein ACREFX_12500 [Opitutaceae bacterium]